MRLRLDYRPPLAWDALLAFLSYRAIPGVEAVSGGAYHRTVALDGKRGHVSVSRDGTRLVATVSASLVGVLMPLVAKLRSLFDLDAHPTQVDAVLARDPALRARVKRNPSVEDSSWNRCSGPLAARMKALVRPRCSRITIRSR